MLTMRTKLVTIDSEIMSGEPVFTGTRVPVRSMIDHLREGETLGNFLTVDSSLPSQQHLSNFNIAVIVLNIPSNSLRHCLPLVPQILSALNRVRKGEASPGKETPGLETGCGFSSFSSVLQFLVGRRLTSGLAIP